MFDVTAIGELLIDMAQLGMSDIGSSDFQGLFREELLVCGNVCQ